MEPESLLHGLYMALDTGNPAELELAVRTLLECVEVGEVALVYASEEEDDELTADGLSVRDEAVFFGLDNYEEDMVED